MAAWLWSFRRRNVMVSVYAGSVLAFLPVYGLQILIGLGLALLLRGNLTVMVGLQMIVNPLTIVPIDGLTGWVGLRALVIGGVLVGLAFAVLADLTWRLIGWEARRFRERRVRAAPRNPSAAPDRG